MPMDMKIWTVITQKGGAGKTTTAVNLAVISAIESGERTLLIDCDEQRSATTWWESRTADESAPYLIRAQPGRVRDDIEQARDHGFTHVIIDTPGFAGIKASEAASASTLAIVPCQPSVADIRSTFDTARMLKDNDVPFVFLLNRCPTTGREVAEASDAFRGIGMLCDQVCHDRKGHKRAYATGMGITEYAQIDRSADAAAVETREIHRWLLAKERRLHGSSPFADAPVERPVVEGPAVERLSAERTINRPADIRLSPTTDAGVLLGSPRATA